MGEHVIRVPDIGEGIAEVELVAWQVAEGEQVHEDQPLAEVMTDKACVEIPSPVSGRVLALNGEPGQRLAVGSPLIRIGLAERSSGAAGDEGRPDPIPAPGAQRQPGRHVAPGPNDGGFASRPAVADPEVPQALVPAGNAGAPVPGAAATPVAFPARAGAVRREAGVVDESPGHVLAAPAVRHRARRLGVSLDEVAGTGPRGRVLHEDLDAWLVQGGQRTGPTRQPPSGSPASSVCGSGGRVARVAASAAEVVAPQSGDEMSAAGPAPGPQGAGARRTGTQQVAVTGLRRRIAERMQQSMRRIPHFGYVEEVDVTALLALRSRLNEGHEAQRGRLSLLPFIALAMVRALREFPQINARFDDEAGIITRHEGVHLGVAVQAPAGLMVVVVRHLEALDLWGVAAEVARLAGRARAGRATREELGGSTITLSSLGSLGGIASTPVINHPEVAIIAVNRIVEKPAVLAGQVVIRQTMNLSSSFDHRVVDGMDAAAFIQAVRQRLETPALLFVD